jgi:predicted acylesterase/phospholipase RssA
VDLVLSSGFLAFGAQAGFLAGLEALAWPVDGICGTSSGALAGALWSAGLTARRVLDVLAESPPLAQVRPSRRPWQGILSMDPVIAHLRRFLPARIEALPRPLGVGIVRDGVHAVVTAGPLPEAVAASCAMPYVFAPLAIEGTTCSDGGAADRTGIDAWRALRGVRPTILHLVARSHGPAEAAVPDDVRVVRSPRSGARLWSLGPVRERFEAARRVTILTLRQGATRWPRAG